MNHGMSKTSFYCVWNSLKRRCNNPNNKDYKYYGGRGIKMCERWESFINFKEDMYDSYTKHRNNHPNEKSTIDRIDVNGDYCLENCRWITQAENNANRRGYGIGIQYYKQFKKWRVQKTFNGKKYNWGYHETYEQAKEALEMNIRKLTG